MRKIEGAEEAYIGVPLYLIEKIFPLLARSVPRHRVLYGGGEGSKSQHIGSTCRKSLGHLERSIGVIFAMYPVTSDDERLNTSGITDVKSARPCGTK